MTDDTTVVRELPCILTEAELLERGDEMAACEQRVEELKNERRKLNAAMRAQSDRRGELARIIESKSEQRDVPCRWEPDYDAKRYDLVRSDTGENIDQRDMPEADLQMRLLPGGADDDTAPTPAAKRGRKRAPASKAAN